MSELSIESGRDHRMRPAAYSSAARALRTSVATHVDWVLALAVGCVALGIYFFRTATTSLWGDEAFSVGLANQPWHTQLRLIWSSEVNMTLYYLVLRGWLHLTALLGMHQTELLVRFPSIILASLSAVVVFALGRRMAGRSAGIIAAGLYSLSYLQLMMAGQARSYALTQFLICLSWYALVAALDVERPRWPWWACYALTITLAMYAHVVSGLVFGSQVVALACLYLARDSANSAIRRSMRPLLICLTTVCLLVAPLAYDAAIHGSVNTWMAPPTFRAVLREVWEMTGHNIAFALVLVVACALAVLAALQASPIRIATTRNNFLSQGQPSNDDKVVRLPYWSRTFALLCWIAVPFVVSYVVSLRPFNLHLFGDYLVVVVPSLCLLAGSGVAALKQTPHRVVLGAILLISAVPGLFLYYGNAQRQDFRTASFWLEHHYRTGDGIVCDSYACAVAMEFYLQPFRGAARLTRDAPSPISWGGPPARPLTAQSLAIYASTHPRVFFIDSVLSGDSATIKTNAQAARQWLDLHARLLSRISTSAYYGPVTARLYALSHT